MVQSCGSHAELLLQFQGLRFPSSHLTALEQLLRVDRVPAAQLQLLKDEDRLGLLLGLWSEGLLQVCQTQ